MRNPILCVVSPIFLLASRLHLWYIIQDKYWLMNNDKQNDFTYHQVQQLINDQIDRIENETDATTKEETQKHDHTEISIIVIIKRLWRMKRLRKKRRKS